MAAFEAYHGAKEQMFFYPEGSSTCQNSPKGYNAYCVGVNTLPCKELYRIGLTEFVSFREHMIGHCDASLSLTFCIIYVLIFQVLVPGWQYSSFLIPLKIEHKALPDY